MDDKEIISLRIEMSRKSARITSSERPMDRSTH